ncbi:polynucleotide adenylyltransferase PcnB [Ramlibacter sp.]|uniref:polynucleotide adenylyltransferase PcnB n=1 Tax=Ramlibacter sp. TaxID=1917967 RepID=UPI003D0FDF22
MIKKFIDKLLGTGPKPKFGKRQEVGPDEHGIDPSLVDERALNVVHTLKEAGFEAYIVGGAVRDLLLGLRPKDFDVATNATPEEVKSRFRRAFIIGRRFRIVHVVYGRGREHEVIEVSTFRAYLDSAQAEAVSGNERTSKSELAGMTHAVDASGRVLRDNVWGPQEEDAARRDFTINGLYYDPERRIVVDYHGGIKDAKKRVIRMIGDPAARFREDPVRIVRAVRFVAKLAALGFKLEPKTAAPLRSSLKLLADVPQSRLFDEMLKLLQTGHAIASIEQLRALDLHGIYPLLDVVVERADEPLIKAALLDTDRRCGEGKPVAPSFLLACVLWPDVREGWARRLADKQHPFPALQDAIDNVFDARIGDVSGRGKLGADMREIWMMQPRFEKRTGNTPFSLVEQPRFRAAFDFMRLRADAGEVDVVLADWWQEFSIASDAVREDLVAQLRDEQQKHQRRVRTVRPAPSTPRAAQGEQAGSPERSEDSPPASRSSRTPSSGEGGDAGEPTGDAPRKRRRRRRKPAGDGSAAPPAE